MSTRKKNKKTKNITKKCRPTQQDLAVYCRQNANTFNQFEKKYEETFKNKLHEHHQSVEKELIKLFKTPFTPTKYREQDDYYTYINYQWIRRKTKAPTDKSQYYVQVDNFRIIQDKVYYELIDIVKEYIKNNNTRKAKDIKKVYDSLYNLEDKSTFEYILFYTNKIENYIQGGNIYDVLGYINRNEIISWGCPVGWYVSRDLKNNKYYKSNIGLPQLTLYDFYLYIEDPKDDSKTKKYKNLVKRKYFKFIQTLFDECLGKGHGFTPQNIWDCECDMLDAMYCYSIKDDDQEGYNVLTQKDGLRYGFDWEQLAKKIGYKTIPKTFICNSTNYLTCIMKTLTTDNAWQTKKWQAYYLYIALRQVMRFNHKWRIIHFEFFDKFIAGQEFPYPKEVYPVFGLSFCFNTFLTNEYIDRNKKQQLIDYTNNMATDLLTVFKRIIKRNTWLSPSTKKSALLKLNNFNLMIGSPKLLREDPLLEYRSDEPYWNVRKAAFWRTKKCIELDGKSSDVDIPIIDWKQFKIVGKQSYVVNAFYTPSENSIYIPLAYLQKPFIDLDERGIEYNLANIGYTLGHEMSHSLDDFGSKYDEKGNLNNWWTKEDRKIFNSKVNNVIEQYETYASYDGIVMDASLSTGEDLADISGMAICQEYLKDFQENNDDVVPIRAISFHAFFIYLAIASRQKILSKAIKSQLKINPHPLNKYRVNCPLSRLGLFRSLYNIKPTDKMYWPSLDTIW